MPMWFHNFNHPFRPAVGLAYGPLLRPYRYNCDINAMIIGVCIWVYYLPNDTNNYVDYCGVTYTVTYEEFTEMLEFELLLLETDIVYTTPLNNW